MKHFSVTGYEPTEKGFRSGVHQPKLEHENPRQSKENMLAD